jgi:hypothetical protein
MNFDDFKMRLEWALEPDSPSVMPPEVAKAALNYLQTNHPKE